MHALPEPSVDRYLRLVRAGLADLGASGAQMGRLVPPRVAPPGAPEAPAEVAPPAGTAQLTAEDGGGAGTYAADTASAEPTPPAATSERSGTAPAARGGATAVTGGATRADAPPSSGNERP